MDRLTRKTNGKDYFSHCRYIEKTNELFGREEKPLAPDEYYKQEPYKVEDSYYDEDILVKLGKLEDLEEELGCPLEVIFKALKEDIIDIEGSRVSVCLEYIQASQEWLLIGKFCRTAYYVKDYQKTWRLKGEKENDRRNIIKNY